MENREDTFGTLFRIMSNPRFLAMEGLGKEVPYFIHAYDITIQEQVYRKLDGLIRRLNLEGVTAAAIGLYDFVIERFRSAGELEDLFTIEPTVKKSYLLENMMEMLPAERVIVPEIVKRVEDSGAKLVIIFQVGEVYPYIRAHEILTTLQSYLCGRPVVVFFPGEFTSSYHEGLKLRLFGRLESRYYRAFTLEDYIVRGNIHADS